SHSKTPVLPGFGIAAFLMAHNHYGLPVHGSQPTYNGFIIAFVPVAVKFHKIFTHFVNIIKGVRAFVMTGQLYLLPTGEVGKDGGSKFINPFSKMLNFG